MCVVIEWLGDSAVRVALVSFPYLPGMKLRWCHGRDVLCQFMGHSTAVTCVLCTEEVGHSVRAVGNFICLGEGGGGGCSRVLSLMKEHIIVSLLMTAAGT